MTGTAKQSIARQAQRWIASSLTLLAMTVELPRRNGSFIICVDRIFTTSIEPAFTNALDAIRKTPANACL
jgi:hypothetical protein